MKTKKKPQNTGYIMKETLHFLLKIKHSEKKFSKKKTFVIKYLKYIFTSGMKRICFGKKHQCMNNDEIMMIG